MATKFPETLISEGEQLAMCSEPLTCPRTYGVPTGSNEAMAPNGQVPINGCR